MERRIQSRDKQVQDLLKQLSTSKDARQPAGTQGASKPPPSAAQPAKPMMLDNKGQLREIAWTCGGCHQPHWSQNAMFRINL
jgi:hypothetical protein